MCIKAISRLIGQRTKAANERGALASAYAAGMGVVAFGLMATMSMLTSTLVNYLTAAIQ